MCIYQDLIIPYVLLHYVDKNECQTGHNCQQICHNTIGSYTCSCNQAYDLNSDGRTCTGKGLLIQTLYLAWVLNVLWAIYYYPPCCQPIYQPPLPALPIISDVIHVPSHIMSLCACSHSKPLSGKQWRL